MPSTLVYTAGASNANSYASLARARVYYSDHPYATDEDLDDDEKLTQALIQATALIDDSFTWDGEASDPSTQALAFPRTGLLNIAGGSLDSTTIPARLEDATAELARQLLASDRTADSQIETQGITSLKAGPIELKFQGAAAKPIPDRVVQMLSRWGWLGTRQSSVRKLVRA